MELLRYIPAGKEDAGGFRTRSGNRRFPRWLTGFECPEIQSDLMQEIQFGGDE
jgi:hypothetical protein